MVHWATVSNQLAECRQVDLTVATQNRLACKTAIEALFATAPPYSSSAIRITMFISFFWYRPVFFKEALEALERLRTELALEVVSEDSAWTSAKVGRGL